VNHTRRLGVYRVVISRADNGAHIGSLNATVYRTGKPLQLPAG
jgi:hypothetical protein